MYLAYFNSMYEEETQASIKHLLPRLSSVQLCNVRVQIANKVITTIVWQELCHYVQVKMGWEFRGFRVKNKKGRDMCN